MSNTHGAVCIVHGPPPKPKSSSLQDRYDWHQSMFEHHLKLANNHKMNGNKELDEKFRNSAGEHLDTAQDLKYVMSGSRFRWEKT